MGNEVDEAEGDELDYEAFSQTMSSMLRIRSEIHARAAENIITKAQKQQQKDFAGRRKKGRPSRSVT